MFAALSLPATRALPLTLPALAALTAANTNRPAKTTAIRVTLITSSSLIRWLRPCRQLRRHNLRKRSGQAFEKRPQVFLFRVREIEFEQLRRFVRPRASPLIVKLDDFFNRGERTGVHIRSRHRHVPQTRHLERALVLRVLRHLVAPQI